MVRDGRLSSLGAPLRPPSLATIEWVKMLLLLRRHGLLLVWRGRRPGRNPQRKTGRSFWRLHSTPVSSLRSSHVCPWCLRARLFDDGRASRQFYTKPSFLARQMGSNDGNDGSGSDEMAEEQSTSAYREKEVCLGHFAKPFARPTRTFEAGDDDGSETSPLYALRTGGKPGLETTAPPPSHAPRGGGGGNFRCGRQAALVLLLPIGSSVNEGLQGHDGGRIRRQLHTSFLGRRPPPDHVAPAAAVAVRRRHSRLTSTAWMGSSAAI